VRDLCDDISDGLAQPWVRSIRLASTSRFDDLGDRLDRVITTTDLGVAGTPLWCRAVRVLQWVLFVTAVVGGLWLAGLAATAYLQMPTPGTPDHEGFPVPTLMLVLGVVAGLVLALLSRLLISVASKSRARRAERRLREGVALVADELVVTPVSGELAAYRQTWEGLRTARG
jgi:hypothetical protein